MEKRISNKLAEEILNNGGKARVTYRSVMIAKKLNQEELEELYKGCSRIPKEHFSIIGFITKTDYQKILVKLAGNEDFLNARKLYEF